MKRLILNLAVALGFLTAGPVVHAEPDEQVDAARIMQCVRDRFPASVSVRRVTLTTTGPAGEKSTMSGRVYGMLEKQPDGSSLMRGMLAIDEPPSLQGSAYLVRETEDYLRDGMFVYLPSVGRVRRITGGVADNPLMGTEFSYFEFKQLANAFGDLTATFVRRESVAGRATLVMELKPLESVETRYTSVTTWVDKETCLIVGAEFYEGGKVIKRYTAPASGISSAGDYLYLKEMRMADLLDGSQTVMFIDQVTLNDEPSSLRFSPKTFYLTK